MIADDEAPIREILKIYCEKEGFDVIEAADGAEAILKVQSEKPDIIILDIMMPVLDGLEVCKQVRKMSDIPIIMLTAKDDDDDRILGLEIGADDYITKPFNNREVIARVKAVLRRSSAVKKDEAGGRSHIEYRGLSIDMEKYQVIAFGKKRPLPRKKWNFCGAWPPIPARLFRATSFWKQFGAIPITAIHARLIRILNVSGKNLIFLPIPIGILQPFGA